MQRNQLNYRLYFARHYGKNLTLEKRIRLEPLLKLPFSGFMGSSIYLINSFVVN